MIVLGLDPGSRVCGYAALQILSPGKQEIIELGSWEFASKLPFGERLEQLHDRVAQLVDRLNPRWVGLEMAVAHKNVNSAFKLSEARGVIRLALHQKLAQAEDRLLEISPTAVKKSATGLGISDKSQVQKVLRFRFPELQTLATEDNALSHDAFDALAIAWAALSISQSVQNPLNSLKETPTEV